MSIRRNHVRLGQHDRSSGCGSQGDDSLPTFKTTQRAPWSPHTPPATHHSKWAGRVHEAISLIRHGHEEPVQEAAEHIPIFTTHTKGQTDRALRGMYVMFADHQSTPQIEAHEFWAFAGHNGQ